MFVICEFVQNSGNQVVSSQWYLVTSISVGVVEKVTNSGVFTAETKLSLSLISSRKGRITEKNSDYRPLVAPTSRPPGHNWRSRLPQDHNWHSRPQTHDQIFVIEGLRKVYTKGEPYWTNTDRDISDLLHPYHCEETGTVSRQV